MSGDIPLRERGTDPDQKGTTPAQRGTAPDEDSSKKPPRDPFARPGLPGNRGIRYGSDGPIPPNYRSKVDKAIDLAYMLNDNARFVEVFRETVSKLSGKDLQRDVYLNALDKMVIHYAETSTDMRIQKEMKEDAEKRKKDPKYSPPAAFSFANGNDVWLREFQLRKDAEAIAGSIMHEAAHLAGAPTHMGSDFMLAATIHKVGYPNK